MLEISPLFNFKFLFVAESLFALLLFGRVLRPRRGFIWRLPTGIFFLFLFTFFLPIHGLSVLGLSMLFFSLFGATLLLLYFCTDVSCTIILFCGISAYTAQHLADSLYELIDSAASLDSFKLFGYDESTVTGGLSMGAVLSYILYFDVYFLVYWLVYLIWGRRLQKNEDIRMDNKFVLFLSSIIIGSDIVLNAYAVVNNEAGLTDIYKNINNLYSILCCILVFLIEFGKLTEKQLSYEADINHQLWLRQRQQYILAKENIERINIKCHDLKHQIRQITEKSTLSPETIREIEHTIAIYDSNIQSGNEALNTILTEKMLLCGERSIRLTCLADGAHLSFMRDEDVYSFFGNALDNAIEAVSKLRNTEKRVIGLKIRVKGKFLLLCIYNYFQDRPTLINGLPVTSKTDKEEHGFGMRSMQEIVGRYCGTMTFSMEEDVFNLNVVFPLISEK